MGFLFSRGRFLQIEADETIVKTYRMRVQSVVNKQCGYPEVDRDKRDIESDRLIMG